MQVDMPSFMQRRKRVASASAPKSDSKAAKVVADAEAAAAASGGTKGTVGKRQSILEQLVVILTRLSLANARDLAEVLGVLFCCVLLPVKHVTAQSTLESGEECQEQVKELKAEKAEYAKAKGAKTKEKEDEAALELDEDEDEEEEADMEAPQELIAPHVHICLASLSKTINEGMSGETAEATTARRALKAAWDEHLKDKEEEEVKAVVRVWRGRRPPKKGKGKKRVKMIISCIPEVQGPLVKYLLPAPGPSWLPLAPPGSPWLPLAPPGSSWLLLAYLLTYLLT